MNLLFATNNEHKIEEVQYLLKGKFHILSLSDISCNEELSETGNTLEENARQKASYIHKKFGAPCFADDTGLEIDALNGEPGVLSARYAGQEKIPEKNIEKVLFGLRNAKNRKARFKTIISLLIDNNEYLFEGIINGTIAQERQGEQGFGYDPIFIPDGFEKSFAQMNLEEKNLISHRALAIKKLATFLNNFKS